MESSREEQQFGADFNLEGYRNLLERLQASKRKEVQLNKKTSPRPTQAQT
jgi:hypothetical protein